MIRYWLSCGTVRVAAPEPTETDSQLGGESKLALRPPEATCASSRAEPSPPGALMLPEVTAAKTGPLTFVISMLPEVAVRCIGPVRPVTSAEPLPTEVRTGVPGGTSIVTMAWQSSNRFG